jgi:hypothetical protein
VNHQGTKNTKGTKREKVCIFLVPLVPWWL